MQIRVVRLTVDSADRRRISQRLPAVAGLALAVIASLSVGAASGQATDPSDVATVLLDTAPPPVRSISVTSPVSNGYSRCWDKSGKLLASPKLSFPNGICQATGITVTNTGVDAYITGGTSPMINNDLIPLPGGNTWYICTAAGCANGGLPGQDQFNVMTTTLELPAFDASVGTLPGGVSPYYTQLNQAALGLPGSSAAACDYSLTSGPSCLVPKGQPGNSVKLLLVGPKNATLEGSKWFHNVVWTATAVPPPAPTFSRENQPLKLFY